MKFARSPTEETAKSPLMSSPAPHNSTDCAAQSLLVLEFLEKPVENRLALRRLVLASGAPPALRGRVWLALLGVTPRTSWQQLGDAGAIDSDRGAVPHGLGRADAAAAVMRVVMPEHDAVAAMRQLATHGVPRLFDAPSVDNALHAGCALVADVLKVVDPELAVHTCGASPFDMYAARVASLYAERQPLCDVVRLWDAVLAGGPHVVLTLCVAEALLRRGELLAIGCDGVAACFSGGGASRSSSREVGVCALLAVPVETFLSLAARVEAALPAAMRAALHAWSVRVSMPLASGTVAVTMTADRDVHTPRMLVGTDRVQCVLPPKAPVLRATAARGARATARRRAAAIARSDSSDSDSDSDEGTTRRRQRQAPSASVSSAGTSPPQLTSTSSPSDVAALPDGGESEARPSASRGALPSSAVPDVAAPAWRALHAFRAPPAAAAVYHALGVAAVRAWTAAHPLHLNDALSASAGGAADHDGGTISGSEPADVPASGAPAATTVRVHPSVALRRRMGSIVTSAAPASAPLPIAPAASRPPTSMVQVLRAAVAAGDLEVSERRTYRPRVPDAQEAVPAFARPSHAAGARAPHPP